MKTTALQCWIAALGLTIAGAASAQSNATARPGSAASAAAAKVPAPGAAASAPPAKPAASAAPAGKVSARQDPAAARVKSLKVQVLFVESAGQSPKPVAGAVVRLQGSEQTFATNALGVAQVFGALEGKPQLTVIVVNASICNLPVKAAGGSLTVLVPKRGQGACRIGP